MFFKSFFDENLAQMSYMVGCQKTGEALVIDPARDITPYLTTAKKEGFDITSITETHIHADYLSGARELAEKTGGKLYLSDEGDDDWKYGFAKEYSYQWLKGGDHFYVGNVKLDVLHTPGHTPESLSYLLTDEGGGSSVPMGIFTGDFVFVGDVGRPDLLEKAAGASGSSEVGAKDMFKSLQRFKELPDYVQVWPGHGAGSACGKSLGAVPSSTVGYEKINNWALSYEEEASFIDELLEGQPEPPKYFTMMKKLNKEGPALLDDHQSVEKMNIEQTQKAVEQGNAVIDTRSKEDFAKGHLPGTINLPFNKAFANWAGWLISYDQDIVLISDESEVEDIQIALQSIGLDRLVGFVNQDDVDQKDNLETYESITADQLAEKFKDHEDYIIVDVRNQSEWDEEHMEGAFHVMLGTLPDRLDEIPEGKTPIVHCQSGIRSAIATSVLQAYGYKDVLNLKGGFSAWKEYGGKVA
ncbi:Zn-dependent hydrolase [Halobacillus andaensis]|uniref:Zn-dependent hydrolase n=1 Tax=Halobacillus andaensis TaxID=1176239 RepID=A0A917B4A7_HALAA|nr:MBL fold metallo-hydrolase [Halobacillus andaensis]MBP2004566.1 hydroxyacylglutathione hydrolase [Halobacillus andaensis]GGF20690.1 Zn-dependent hydrolase [Halobacillus andaensis]